MRRFTSILILLLCLLVLPAGPSEAWFFGSDEPLVTIDDQSYSADDFKRWWKFWNDSDLALPETPEPYIDFLLLAREAANIELDANPGFSRQTRVFLQARSLLMLKYDAVDSRIKVTDSDLQARYQEVYLPRWLVQRLEFRDEGAAGAAWQGLSDKALTIEELLARAPEQGGPQKLTENWLRPQGIDAGWAVIFEKTAVGEVIDPVEHEGGTSLFYLKEKKGGDEDDFAKFKDEIQKDIWKLQEDELSLELLKSLYDKYKVVVNRERIDAIDLTAGDDALTEDVVISTSQQNFTEKEYVAVIRRLIASRPTAAHALGDKEETAKMKAETVNNILAQSLTNWEALDRHYEEKEPFKWEYRFHVDYRLTTALDERIFLPEADVSEDEIQQHYNTNLALYSKPALVKLFILDDTQGPIDQVWADAVVGKDFVGAMKKHLEKFVSAREIPANHLEPEVKAVVDKMAVGETSSPFEALGSQVIVHLISRTPQTPVPLENVKSTIRTKLVNAKVKQLRNATLDKIKATTKIEVNKKQWQAIEKELGGVR